MHNKFRHEMCSIVLCESDMENDDVISDSVRHQLGANNVTYVMDGYWSMQYA